MSYIRYLQQAILALGSTLSIPFILTNQLCSSTNADARAQLLCISMFMCGVATILQTTFGVRYNINKSPHLQIVTYTFIDELLFYQYVI